MKIYLVMHEGANNLSKLEAWADIRNVDENGVYISAVKAFTRKKHAKEWIEARDLNHLVIKSATVE